MVVNQRWFYVICTVITEHGTKHGENSGFTVPSLFAIFEKGLNNSLSEWIVLKFRNFEEILSS